MGEGGRGGWAGGAGLGGVRPREVASHVDHPKVYVFAVFFAIVEDRWARKLFNPPNPGQRQKFMCLSFFSQLSATAGHVNFGT